MGTDVVAAEVNEIPIATVLACLWATSTLFWSIFTHPHRTFAARILLFQPLWLLRIFLDDAIWVQDLYLALFLHSIYSLLTGAWRLYTFRDLAEWLNPTSETLNVYLQVFPLLAACAVLAGLIVHRGQQLKAAEQITPVRVQSIEEALLPPLLITSRTSHSRMFPEKHTFSYSYLFAGIPVGLEGRIGSVLSVDSPKPAWFDIHSKHYLNRGHDQAALGERLKRYLHTRGVTDRDYAFAYLVTAPRFLGYSFNPVSFWYLYDSDTHLRYMILEVNNTFDERRMYLLEADKTKDDELEKNSPSDTEAITFTDTWSKDFHVSPFNSRKGSYSLTAKDPLIAFQETGHLAIDNTIVLRSSKDHPKLIARVWSQGTPISPTAVSTFQLTQFILSWWWVGLLTFPRIVWEAQKLFFRRKLHVWYRPETAQGSIGRSYTDDEVVLEEVFRAFLTDAVENTDKALRVIYEPAHSEGGEIVLYSPCFTYGEDHKSTLTIKVLSPAFYSRFVHYAHAKEAFDRECLATDDKNRTVSIEGAQSLPALLSALKDAARLEGQNNSLGIADNLRWNVLKRLRCPPAAASYPSNPSNHDPNSDIVDIRSFHFSELDRYAQRTSTEDDAYRRIAVKLFMAERVAFGFPPFVALGDWILRASLIIAAMCFADSAKTFDVLRPRSFVRADLVKTALLLFLANAIHLWSFAKG
ncbi:hypothetical protein CLAFUW4_04955 [Fulvia fulva]|uniref:DUF1365-domain-containing protein n=1 Tax=Passalora fulva TaxID=5499 RepID=A0A9Q8PI18_PASFU|nr:uncharacterized protein CLAFUR5_11951 [Fulvia fulva]KAK4626434.1 hypothetical protein CLAFUR4_04941 [Fulvia fulva]KAK4627856.1 hypothetical protein CLAFUR0_04945 [Fulvia fulva]UJO22833.1 hypothetical protein CLAFUR5_11951 [Fulvia fulva]WPV13160.1 hypothetical protein CLAFUW4_04955 [Fulvia fulva]WPV28121.1 hypothetical protein CLAFUW7_04949 [Fulvia fulva]